MEIRQWLAETEAQHVMYRDLLTLNEDEMLAEAAEKLLQEQVSGAPVIDSEGRCVGVLSATDILGADERVEQQRREVSESSFFNSNLALPAHVYAEEIAAVRDKLAPAAEQPVRSFMTSDLVTVKQDTSLEAVVQSMVEAHIHRVVVVDDQGCLKGIISTTDVLAALLRPTPVS